MFLQSSLITLNLASDPEHTDETKANPSVEVPPRIGSFLRRPRLLATLLAIAFALPWGLVKANLVSGIDLSGKWDYQCTAVEGQAFEHGGFMHGGQVFIQQSREDFGTQIVISGSRKWIKRKEQDGKESTTYLERPVSWKSESGAFSGKNSIFFTYETTGQSGVLRGYVSGTIRMKNGQPDIIEGTFVYELPGNGSMSGTFEFKKQ